MATASSRGDGINNEGSNSGSGKGLRAKDDLGKNDGRGLRESGESGTSIVNSDVVMRLGVANCSGSNIGEGDRNRNFKDMQPHSNSDERSGRGLGSSSDMKPIEHVEPQRSDEARLLQSTGDVLMASSSSVVKKCKGRYRIMMKGAACRKACCGDI